MSKQERGGVPKLRPGEPGYVGRGHPPKHGQIRPGETKNPYGRRGKPRDDAPAGDFSSQMQQLYAQPIQSSDGRSYGPAEVAYKALLKRVSTGDVKAISLFFVLQEKYGRPPTAELSQGEIDATDNAILAHFEETIRADAGKDGSEIGGEDDDNV